MTQPLTSKITVVCNQILNKFLADANSGSPTLKTITPNINTGQVQVVQPTSIFYGDQELIKTSPTICVEPTDKTRQMVQSWMTSENVFTVHILCYVGGPEVQTARKQCDEIGEAAEALLHQDLQLTNGVPGAGIVIHGYVQNFQSGYAFRPGLLRTVRLTYWCETKTRLQQTS